jgi:uncharacterized protein YoxC
MTLQSLLSTLEITQTKTTDIREKLNNISREMVVLKAKIESMIATAVDQVDARVITLQREYDDATKNADDHRGCFKDVAEGFKTIFSFGISCAMLDQTLKKAERAANEIDKTKMNFTNNVKPLVGKLVGLNGVAHDLLQEAYDKTAVVRDFEYELKSKIVAFKEK